MSVRSPGRLALPVFLAAALAAAPAQAQLFDPYIIGMMAGPVSDGPSVLVLKKREERFMSAETLIIACSAGAVSGAVAHGLPGLAAMATGVGVPLGAMALAGTGVFGCVVSAAAAATAIGTQWALRAVRADQPPGTGGDGGAIGGREPAGGGAAPAAP